jgi:hypothetical protein
MKKLLTVLFGASWKTSLVSFLGAAALAGATYAQSRPEPGWYIAALALAALGRVAGDPSKLKP